MEGKALLSRGTPYDKLKQKNPRDIKEREDTPMKKDTGGENFTYWKRPWAKWCVLAGALLQIPGISGRLREYRLISAGELLGELAKAEYAERAKFGLACSGILMAVLLGAFCIGCLARSKRQARLAESVLFLVMAAAWAGAYFLLGMHTRGLIWAVFLVMLLGSGGYSFWEWKKEK